MKHQIYIIQLLICLSIIISSCEKNEFYLEYNITPVKCNGEKNGRIDLTLNEENGPYQYIWKKGMFNGIISREEDLVNIESGIYKVEISGANGIFLEQSFEVEAPEVMEITANVTHNELGKENTGIVNLSVEGGISPFSYQWSNNETTQDITNLATNHYSVIVEDFRGCKDTLYKVVKGEVVDKEGNIYNTVNIGGQMWMAEDLRASTGTWLEDYYSATVTDDVCPEGWHISTEADWNELINYISSKGFEGREGVAIRSTLDIWSPGVWIGGCSHCQWFPGTDSFGFNANPNLRYQYHNEYYLRRGWCNAFWWMVKEANSSENVDKGEVEVNSYFENIHFNEVTDSHHRKIRCVKNK